jgi:hypothetical protein
MPSAPRTNRTLLATMTHEPFQPVRLYYAIPGRAPVTARLRELECVVEVPNERCWQWLFHGEAASLRFSAGYDDVPVERRPIILGRIRFPKNGGMTLQTNSILRAIEAARFFGPRLGPQVVAMRCRVVNRCFAAEEGKPDDLMKTLDQNVSVIDPRVAELALEWEFKGRPRPRTMQEVERVAAESLQRRIKSKEDVPLVEDYPLHPDEETSEFRDLANGLHLRAIRALEHYNGNTHLTLTAIIVRAVEQGMGAGDQQGQGA